MILTLTDMFHKILHGIMWYPCTSTSLFLHWEGIMWNTHAVCTCTLYLDYYTTVYHIFLPCFLNITSAITHGRCILHTRNSTICCGILWNCIFIVVLYDYGCSSKFHNCGTLWYEPVFKIRIKL